MKREHNYGTALTAVGVVTLPFFVGIPLLAVGILLLAMGERIRAERWIRVLFWMVPVALALAVTLFLLFPIEGGHDAESSIARSILCASPMFLAILISLAMAALTVAQFPSLSRKHRVMGLGFGVLCGLGAGVALVLAFPWLGRRAIRRCWSSRVRKVRGSGSRFAVSWLGSCRYRRSRWRCS